MSKEQNKAVEKALTKIIPKEVATELANIEGEKLETVYHLLQEQIEYNGMMPEQSTVQSVLQELYEFNQSTCIATDGEPVDLEVYQDLIYQYIEQLADLIGAELEG